jgi:hypothetical protein
VILVLVRWLENLRKDMGDAVQSGDVKRVDRNVIDAESGFGGTYEDEKRLVDKKELQRTKVETMSLPGTGRTLLLSMTTFNFSFSRPLVNSNSLWKDGSSSNAASLSWWW